MIEGDRLAGKLYDHRTILLIVTFLVSVAMIWPATKVGIDNSLEVWFLDDDPTYQEYKRFQLTYGNDEVVAIAVEHPEGFLSEAGLQHLTKLENQLKNIEGVAEVTSITRFFGAWEDGYGGSFKRLSEHPAIQGRLLSSDEKSAIIVVEFKSFKNIDAVRPEILSQIRNTLVLEGAYHLAGIGVIYDALNQLAMEDSAVFIGLGYLVIVLLLWHFLGNFLLVLTAISAAGLSSLWLMGVYGAAGRDINMVTMVMPSLLLVICVSMCIHIFHNNRFSSKELDPRQRVINGLGIMIIPCIFNVLTTGAGFLSLGISPLKVVKDLGIFSALGLMSVLFISLMACVFVLAKSKVNVKHRHSEIDSQHHRLTRIIETLVNYAIRRPYVILVMSFLIVVLGATGIQRIVVDTDSLGFIVDDHKVPTDSRAIETKIGPYTPLEFVITGANVLSSETIRALQLWEKEAVESGVVGWSNSVGTYIGHFPIASSLEIMQDFPVVDGLWEQLVNEPNELRVTFGLPIQSVEKIEQSIDTLLSLEKLPENVSVKATGYIPLYVRMMSMIVETLLYSLAIALVIIFLMFALLFRSWQLVLISLPSNILPILLLLGCMGWAGIHLDIATVTIAAIVFGLVVDDTVQFLYRYRHLQKTYPPIEAVRLTTKTIGHSMVITTIVFSAGLSVLMFANVKSIIWFGMLIPGAMIFALLADLLILPALISVVEKRKMRIS